MLRQESIGGGWSIEYDGLNLERLRVQLYIWPIIITPQVVPLQGKIAGMIDTVCIVLSYLQCVFETPTDGRVDMFSKVK